MLYAFCCQNFSIVRFEYHVLMFFQTIRLIYGGKFYFIGQIVIKVFIIFSYCYEFIIHIYSIVVVLCGFVVFINQMGKFIIESEELWHFLLQYLYFSISCPMKYE